MKELNEHPKEDCQFVVVWENDTGIWASNLQLVEGELYEWDEASDRWQAEPHANPYWPHNCIRSNKNYRYFVS